MHVGAGNAAGIQDKDVEVLNQRLAEARQGDLAAAAVSSEDEAAAAQRSFLASTDDEMASALADRIAEVAQSSGGPAAGSSSGGDVASASADGQGGSLTGPLLRELIYNKWGKAFDLSFVRRDLPLGKTLICLNVSVRDGS
jgi:hypothetical protein